MLQMVTVEQIEQLPHVKPTNPLTIPVVAHLLSKGYSQSAIARTFHISVQAVNQYIKHHADELEELKNYDDVMTNLLKATSLSVIKSVEDKDYKKASLQQKITSGAICIEKIRLLTDKSTQNIGHNVVVSSIQDATAELKQIMESLDNDGS